MDSLDWFLLALSAVVAFQITKEIFSSNPLIEGLNLNKEHEARQFFENNNDTRKREYSLPSGIGKIGLSVAKKSNDEKYDLIPQIKISPKLI